MLVDDRLDSTITFFVSTMRGGSFILDLHALLSYWGCGQVVYCNIKNTSENQRAGYVLKRALVITVVEVILL